MTRALEWSDDAADDFNDAIEHIALDSPSGARLISSRILAAIDLLAEMPTGHQGRVEGTYEKFVQKTSYIIAYRLTARAVYITRIIHGARDWPAGDWPSDE